MSSKGNSERPPEGLARILAHLDVCYPGWRDNQEPAATERAAQRPSPDGLKARLRKWARLIKQDIVALYIACRDARTPLAAKITAGIVLAYALSPIDLIPDFIPVLGFIDDLILLPLGILAVVRLVPASLMSEYRLRASMVSQRPRSMLGAIIVVAIWLAAAGLFAWAWLA